MRCGTAVPIGAGATGEVVRAWDPDLERDVAFKYLHSTDPLLVERLFREARAQARLDHPSICKVYEVGEQNGRPYIAMQFVDGERLDTAAAALPLEKKIILFLKIVDAIQAAHEAGLVHRDLKPANILVTDREGEAHPFILDFGIALLEEAPGLTLTGQLIGTPGYLSPEQARGEVGCIDRRTDIFSLGIILYELLSGSRPFGGESAVEQVLSLLEEDPPSLRSRAPVIPRDLDAITMHCLQKDPEGRYPSARALAEDLARWMCGEPVLAERRSPFAPLVQAVRRHRVAFSLATLVIAGAIGGAVKYTVDLGRQERKAVAARQDAEKLVGFMLQDLFSSLQPLGRLDLLDQVAEETLRYYGKFGEDELQLDQRMKRALVRRNLAKVLDARGKNAEALRELRSAVAIFEAEGEKLTPPWRSELASMHSKIAEILQDQGDLENSRLELDKGLQTARKLFTEHPEEQAYEEVLVELLINVGWLEREKGQWEDALHHLQEARSIVSIQPGDRHTAFRMSEVESYRARVLQEAGDPAQAESVLFRVRKILRKLAAEEAGNTRYEFELVLTDERLGSVAEDMEDPERALHRYEEGLERGQRLVVLDPTNAIWKREVAVLDSSIGALRLARGDAAGARNFFRAGLEISESLASVGGDSASVANDLAWDWLQLGLAEEALYHEEKARAAWERSVKLMAPIVARTPEVWYLDTWARALLHLGRIEEARPAVRQLLEADWEEEDFRELVERAGLR